MKLGKDELQKIFLGVLMLLTLAYGYFEMLLSPLKKAQAANRKEIAALTASIAEARAHIRKAQEAEATVPGAERVVKQVKAMIPEGAPVAWFPTHVAEHFKRQGVDKAATRLNSEQLEKDLAGFRRMFWSVDLAKVEFVPFAQALADFENEEPLVEISNIQISAAADNVELQRVSLNLRTLVTQ
jgi:hypothetical protein